MENKIFDSFLGLYSKSITIRNGLKPMWETGTYLEQSWEEDQFKDRSRNEYYPILKKVLDRKHEEVITKGLEQIRDSKCIDWNSLERNSNNPDMQKEEMHRIRKTISDVLESQPEYALLQGDAPFKPGGVIDDPALTEEERTAFQLYARFSTRLKNYRNNRDNYYSSEAISTAVSYRIVDENFRTYCVNLEVLQQLMKGCPTYMDTVTHEWEEGWKQYTDINGYNCVLTQKDIDRYNEFVGIYNKCANLYIQKMGNNLPEAHPFRSKKNRQLRVMYKQIGCTQNKIFSIEKLENDEQVIGMIEALRSDLQDRGTLEMFDRISDSETGDWNGIYLSSQALSEVSLRIADIADNGSYTISKWSIINSALRKNWMKDLPENLSPDALEKKLLKREKTYYSMSYLRDVLEDAYSDNTVISTDLGRWFDHMRELSHNVIESEKNLRDFLAGINGDTSLREISIEPLKFWCDSWLNVFRACKVFEFDVKEERDKNFYELIEAVMFDYGDFVSAYNKIRNYVTKKPYSTDKMLLKFNNPQLTDGWTKERDYGAFLMKRNGKYYLALFNNRKKKFQLSVSTVKENESDFEKMVYCLFKDVSKMIPKCSTQLKKTVAHFEQSSDDYVITSDQFLRPFTISKRVYDLNNETYEGKKMWQKDFLTKNPGRKAEYKTAVFDWITFCMEFLKAYKSTADYDYSQLSSLEEYENVADFYNDVDKLLYKIDYTYVTEANIREYVANGDIFLFQIYNKDFSDHKRQGSKKNLHTLYWEALFSEANSREGIIKLNGGAELFRRPCSIKKKTIHRAGEILVNKRTIDEKREPIPNAIYVDLCHYFNGRKDQVEDMDRIKPYLNRVATFTKQIDIIKDKRFTEDKYEIHIPMTINYRADGVSAFNARVLQVLKNNPDVNIIGLDRGERNLITCTVINQKGVILKQKSFNIINEMDYQSKLAQCERNRNDERVNWKNIENIKELKAGYISQVVHELVDMMIAYNAIVVMEDLNYGFKRGRFRVERQVYQKFEVALLNKLQYVVNNKTDDFESDERGSILHGYQLAFPVDSLKNVGNQCGFVFYVPAAYTSKIDPVTGFVNVFDMTQVSNRVTRKIFFGKFEDIFYDRERDLFGFSFDYSKFATFQTCARRNWTAYSVGERYIFNPRTRKAELINPTQMLKDLFVKSGVEYEHDLFTQIKALTDDRENAEFWSELDFCFQTILRLRNSNAEKDLDQIISPVMNDAGEFMITPEEKAKMTETRELPNDADTNGAYHIALKGLLLLTEHINKTEIAENGKIPREMYSITNAEWLAYRQVRGN